MKKEKFTCQLCNRNVIKDYITKHHLIPRSEGGKLSETITVCITCHTHIHATFNNNVLKNKYNTLEALLNNKSMKKFIDRISKRRDFPKSNKMSQGEIGKRIKSRIHQKIKYSVFEKCLKNLESRGIEPELKRIYSIGFQTGFKFHKRLTNGKTSYEELVKKFDIDLEEI